jgi:hypothetical protein
VAISNNRLVRIEDGNVTCTWRDSRDGNTVKEMTVEAGEFIRRFLLHVLPKNFYKIRYDGLLSSRNRKKLERCKAILGVTTVPALQDAHPQRWEAVLFALTGRDPQLCPKCQQGRMVRKDILSPVPNALPCERYVPP